MLFGTLGTVWNGKTMNIHMLFQQVMSNTPMKISVNIH